MMNLLMDMVFDDSNALDDDDDFDIATAIFGDIGKKRLCKRGGSMMGRDIVRRKRQAGHNKIWDAYFRENPIYGPYFFVDAFECRGSCS